jgi:hypothetical protein
VARTGVLIGCVWGNKRKPRQTALNMSGNIVRCFIINKYSVCEGKRGGVVVKALRYKPAVRGFDYRWSSALNLEPSVCVEYSSSVVRVSRK